MGLDSCRAMDNGDAVGGHFRRANCRISRDSSNGECNSRRYSGYSIAAQADGLSTTAGHTLEGRTEEDIGLRPNAVARLTNKCGSPHSGSGDTGNMTSNEACFRSLPRSYCCSVDGTSVCNSATKNSNDSSSDDTSSRWRDRTVPSGETLRTSEPACTPQLKYGSCLCGSLDITRICQHSKRRDLFSIAVLHGMECPASFAANDGCSGGFHPQAFRGPGADSTFANARACTSPAVVASPTAGFEHRVVGTAGDDNETEGVLGAASKVTPVIDKEQETVKQGPSGGSATIVRPQRVTARRHLDVERDEKTQSAAALLEGQITAPKHPAATEGHSPQSAAAAEERRIGAVVMTPHATVELHSLEQVLEHEARSDHSVHSRAVLSDISPSVLYDDGERRESATPATSLLQHFLQHQRQQRLSLSESFRRRCSDAAALSRAVFRRSSISSPNEGRPASLMQPQSPQQQPSTQTQRQQHELTSERYAVNERGAATLRAPTEMRGQVHTSETRVSGGLSGDDQRRSGLGRRASRAAVSIRASQDCPTGVTPATGTRWSELTVGGNHTLSRYSDNSQSSRDGTNDSDGSSSRSGGGDSGKHMRLHVLQTQRRKKILTADVAPAADAQAAASGLLVEKGRRSVLSTATEEKSVNRQGLLRHAENGRQRKVRTSQLQAVSHSEYHMDMSLKKEEQEPDEKTDGLQWTWSPASPYASLPQQQEADDRPSWGKAHVKIEQPPAQQVRDSASGHRGSRSFPFSFFHTGSRRVPGVPEGHAGLVRQEGDEQRGVGGAIINKQHPEKPLSISRSSPAGEIEVLHRPPVGAAAAALDDVSASSPYLDVPAVSPPVAADSGAAGVSAAQGNSAGRQPVLWERGSDASKGRVKAALQAEVLREGNKQEGDSSQNLQARSPPSKVLVGETAVEDAPSVGRRKNSLLSWLGWRRRQQKKETEASSDAVVLGDLDKATIQVANAAGELPQPHTSLLLPLREQRARRLRTHVIIEIKDGLHRILEVQVAEVLRMLEQQCEADEQQQLLFLAERRRRRAGRCRARLRGHRHDTSGETTTSDSSSSSSGSCEEDTTTETYSSRSGKEGMSRCRGEKEGQMRRKASAKAGVSADQRRSSSSVFSHDHHRRDEVSLGGPEYSCGLSMPLLSSPERTAASQKVSSRCCSPPQSSASSVDRGRGAPIRETGTSFAAAASPHGTKRMRRRRPLSVWRQGEDLGADGVPVHRSAMLVPLLPHASTSEVLAREQPRKHNTRDERIHQGGDLNSIADEGVKAAAIASMLRDSREDRNPLPPSTSATGVSSTIACSSSSNHAQSRSRRCEFFDRGCSRSSRKNEMTCQTSAGGKSGGGSTKRSSKKEAAFCDGHQCCGGASRTSSSMSVSGDNDGRGNDSSNSTCAALSYRGIKKEEDRGCKDETESPGRGQKTEGVSSFPTKSRAKLTSGELLCSSRSNRKEGKTPATTCRCRCPCCGGKSSTTAAVERWCMGCCKTCCCCRKCLCKRCQKTTELKKVKHRIGRGRAGLSVSRSSSLSSLSAAIERQHRYLQLLQQQQQLEQQQQHWQQLKRQQTGKRGKGKAGPDTGRLTYRDCRQAFTDVHPIPSIEVRRHVVLVCLPPVTCFVLWDRVFLLMTDDLEPDHLISQLSKLTRHYAALERKNTAAGSGAASPQSQKERQQVAGGAERQQQQRESLQQHGEIASPGPPEETSQQPGAPHYSTASFPVSMKERRLLQEHVSDYPSLQHPATLTERHSSQLKYQQLVESQQQLLQQHEREKNEGHPSMQQRWRLRNCYSDDAPEALLEDVEEAAASANEAAAVPPLRTEISRSGAAHDPHTRVGSLSCTFAEHPHDRRQQGDPQQPYRRHSASSGSVDSVVGQNSKYISQPSEKAAGRLPRAEQQSYQAWSPPHRVASPVLYEEGNVAAAAGHSSWLGSAEGSAEVSSCGMREEDLHPAVPDRTGTSADLQPQAHRQAPYPGVVGGGPVGKQISKEAAFQCAPRLQMSPLCGAVMPEGVTTSSSAAVPSHHLWEQTPAQTPGGQQQQQQFFHAAACTTSAHVLSPQPPCTLQAPVATATAVFRSGLPAAGDHAEAAASLLTNEQLTPQQQLQAGEQRIFHFHKQQQHQGQQQERREASLFHAPEVANPTRKQSGMHCTTVYGRSDGGASEIAAPEETAATSGSDSNERLSRKRVSSSSMTRSRCPSRSLEKRRGTSSSKRSMPFEFAALECIFFAAFQQLNFDIVYLEKKFAETHQRAAKKSEASSILMEGLHSLKEPVALYEDRVTAFDKAFDELLSNNVDLHRMELTRLHHNPGLYDFDPHKDEVDPELEILLEYFDQEMDQFKGRVRHLKEGIDNTERLISLRLALMRNRLIQWELAAAVVAAGIAIGTCISGIFGMNLANGYEDGKEHSHEMFTIISAVIAVLAVGSVAVVLYLIRTIVL